MARELFIVARDRPELYRYLSQTFADADNVQVIWDRRSSERRQTPGVALVRERRARQRRTRAEVEVELRAMGYVFISLP